MVDFLKVTCYGSSKVLRDRLQRYCVFNLFNNESFFPIIFNVNLSLEKNQYAYVPVSLKRLKPLDMYNRNLTTLRQFMVISQATLALRTPKLHKPIWRSKST